MTNPSTCDVCGRPKCSYPEPNGSCAKYDLQPGVVCHGGPTCVPAPAVEPTPEQPSDLTALICILQNITSLRRYGWPEQVVTPAERDEIVKWLRVGRVLCRERRCSVDLVDGQPRIWLRNYGGEAVPLDEAERLLNIGGHD